MKTECIVLCEPQCWGFEHVPFNSAFIKTVMLAYPGAKLVFLGENEHVSQVIQYLRDSDEGLEKLVEWQEIKIPPRTMGGARRFSTELDWCRTALKMAAACSAKVLILCSISTSSLLASKFLLRSSGIQIPVLVVPHGILASIASRHPRALWNRILGFKLALTLAQPRTLKYLALGEPILRNIEEKQPRIAGGFSSIDLPYLVPAEILGFERKQSSTVRFGFLGVGEGAKGFDRFARLAKGVGAMSLDAEFVLAGFLATKGGVADYSRIIEGIGYKPLSKQEYAARVASLTYAVGLSEPAHYRLAASATFIDAMAFCKPGIYLKNSYLDYYFSRFGDIGYLCVTEKEIEHIVISIARSFPAERYMRQVQNIRHARSAFCPESLSLRLREIVDSMVT